MDEKRIKRLIRLQKEFAKLYKDELVGVSSDYIHITCQAMAELVKQCPDLRIIGRGEDAQYPYEANVTVDGISFCAIGSLEVFKTCGIPVPEPDLEAPDDMTGALDDSIIGALP